MFRINELNQYCSPALRTATACHTEAPGEKMRISLIAYWARILETKKTAEFLEQIKNAGILLHAGIY